MICHSEGIKVVLKCEVKLKKNYTKCFSDAIVQNGHFSRVARPVMRECSRGPVFLDTVYNKEIKIKGLFFPSEDNLAILLNSLCT